jgi:hypothetical protein
VKACNKCGETKPLVEFYKRQSSKDGLQYHCKQCGNERVASIRAANREYMRAYSRSDAGRASIRRHQLKKNYGLTIEQFDALLASQDYSCDCCKRKEPGGRGQWHVDHCHASGEVRGLLCHQYNVGIGCLGDDLQGINNARRYLERYHHVQHHS